MVTVAAAGGRRIVAAADPAALRLGIRPGQPVAQAQACVPGLRVADAAPQDDWDALDALAGWCLRYAPVVEPVPPDEIRLDVAGADHLHGGEGALLADVARRLLAAGIAARLAVADTAGTAAAVARFGPSGTVVPSGAEAAALAPLPVAALRLPPDLCAALARLGAERIGDLSALPRRALALRFGPDLQRRHDQALGLLPEPIVPLVPRTVPQVRRAFPEPLGHLDGLAAALHDLADALRLVLEARDEGVRRLDAVFRRVDGRPLALRVGTAAPSRDAAHLSRLLGERLPLIDPGFGIDEVALVASAVEPLRERQAEDVSLGGEDPAASLGSLVDRLGNRLGAARIYRVAPAESHRPERATRRVPALAPATGTTWPAALPRPSRIFDPPEPVHALAAAPDHPPARFTWRHVDYRVRRADGPERVRGEWWVADEEGASLRDYYRVEDMRGCRFWLFRDGPAGEGSRWWLHGRFS